MKKQMITKSQLREAINGLGPLAPDWLVEALEDFIELQEAHKNLLAMHAEDAYHLEEARAKLYAAPQVSPKVAPTVAIDERAEFEQWFNTQDYSADVRTWAWNGFRAARKLSAPEVVSKTTDTIVPDAKDEIDHEGIWTNSDVAEQRYIQGWNDCRAAMQANCDAMLKGEKCQ